MSIAADNHVGSADAGSSRLSPSSSISSNHSSISSSHWRGSAFDELGWVIQIRHFLDDQQEDEDENVRVSIFNVPKALLQTKPDAYVPQLIALGPYHRLRPELFEMERYKMSAARRTQKMLTCKKLPDIVEAFRKHERRVRAHYHRYLDYRAEVLMWMLVVDTCLLLEFLQVYRLDEDGKVLKRITSRMCHLVDLSGRRSTHNIILRDVMMMENQIPLFLLHKILKKQTRKVDPDVIIASMVTGFMMDLSPFKMVEHFPKIDVQTHAHLLEILYYVLVPNYKYLPKEIGREIEHLEAKVENESTGGAVNREMKTYGDSSRVKQVCSSFMSMASSVMGGPIRFMKGIVTSKFVIFVVKIPWKLLTAIPCFEMLKAPIEDIIKNLGLESSGDGGDKGIDDRRNSDKPPTVEEIMIPSVTELVSAGVHFRPTDGDLTTISFDIKTATFSLPAITLDVNSDVVLRNLVAYEASVATGPLVVARYTELMNGIIDTEEDVKLLRERGIVFNHMKSDEDVAHMWNGMSKSLRLTKVPFMDKAIEDVNHYHNSRWKVKTTRFMKTYVFGSWPFLTFLAAAILLLLTALEAFCSVYSCSRLFSAPILLQQPQTKP